MDLKVNGSTVFCFDLDDTLYNEIDFLKSAYLHIAQELQPHQYYYLYARLFSLYRKGDNVFEFLESQFEISKEQFITKYRNHFPNIKPFPGVVTLFEKLKQFQIPIVCITDGRSKTQRNKLSALGLEHYFDLIIISEEFGTEKPSSHNYEVVERNFPNGNYIYLADNWRKDFLVPNQRNWLSIGLIDNGLNIHNNTHVYCGLGDHSPAKLLMNLSDIRIYNG